MSKKRKKLSKSVKKLRRTITRNGPEAVDIAVGARVRFARQTAGMSQEKLGDAMGLTFQQVQKYERGINRISASKLAVLCKVFGKDPNWFFEAETVPATDRPYMQLCSTLEGLDPANRKKTLRAFNALVAAIAA